MTPEPPLRERSWLHWGLIVAGLYLTWFIALTLPLIFSCFVKRSDLAGFFEGSRFLGLIDVYKEWFYWIIVGTAVLSQFLFLRVPVRLLTKRPVSRKSIWLPVVISGFWFGCLIFGGCAALVEVMKMEIKGSTVLWAGGSAVLLWLVWSIVFYRISRVEAPQELIASQSRWLLRGSILELLIAVPSHIVARGRGDCCAGFFTFFGITMGVSVMLLSFGPAVLLLYHARWRRLKARTASS